MRAVLPNSRSLPAARGYPSPLCPPFSPSSFPPKSHGRTVGRLCPSHVLTRWAPASHSHGAAASKEAPPPPSPLPTPTSQLNSPPGTGGIAVHQTTPDISEGSFLTDIDTQQLPFRGHIAKKKKKSQQRGWKTWRTSGCLHKCRWSST